MALTAPVLFLLLFGIIDFGYVFSSYHELRSASRDGARLAVVDNGCFPGSLDYSASRCASPTQELDNLKADTAARAKGLVNIGALAMQVCYPINPRVGIDNATVKLTYPASSLSGFLGWVLNDMVLESTAIMRLEQVPTYAADPSCP